MQRSHTTRSAAQRSAQPRVSTNDTCPRPALHSHPRPSLHCFSSSLFFQILNISPGTSLAEFLKLASAKLGGFSSSAPAKRAFLADGATVDDAEAIRDNELVYVSAGEGFYKLNQSASSSSSQ